MGTEGRIQAQGPEDAVEEAVHAAIHEAVRLEGLWSRYSPVSEISIINAGATWLTASPETSALLREAALWRSITGGAFDIEYAGGIDLGGIGKGAAVDHMCGILRERGVRRAIVNLGTSSTGFVGEPPHPDGWHVGLRSPLDGSILRTLAVRGAVSTSGTGEQGGHVIDPRDGSRVEGLKSVTVVSQDGVAAEALSTALLVLGREAVPWLRERFCGFSAYFVEPK
jgi:thiamine biosynthesis lipoprotein